MFEEFNLEEFVRNGPHGHLFVNVNERTLNDPEYRIYRTIDGQYSKESWPTEIQSKNAFYLGEYTFLN